MEDILIVQNKENKEKENISGTDENGKLLLKNCFYIWKSADQKCSRGEDILIDKGIIEKIGKGIRDNKAKTIDCSYFLVLPGFVNTHHHFYQTLTRNIPQVQNAKLFDWLVFLYEVWKNLDEEAVYYSSMLAMAELALTGCTCSSDHHYVYPEKVGGDIMRAQFEAATKVGLRFAPTRGSMSRGKDSGGLPPQSVVQTEDQILYDCERVINRFHDPEPMAMRKVGLAPCSPFSVSKDLMKETARIARKYGARLHTHLAETEDESLYCIEKYGVRPLALMEECEFIGKDVSFAHSIFLDDNELKKMAETGTHVAHCPTSNMRLGSGICRVKDMLALGINVALAVDGSASNDSSDMLGEVRNAMLLQRVKFGSDALGLDQVLKIASENGAKLLNFQKTGKICEGWAADLAIFNMDRLEYCGALSDPAGAAVFCGFNHQTQYTFVNGVPIVEKGILKGIDQRDLIEKCRKISDRLIENSK